MQGTLLGGRAESKCNNNNNKKYRDEFCIFFSKRQYLERVYWFNYHIKLPCVETGHCPTCPGRIIFSEGQRLSGAGIPQPCCFRIYKPGTFRMQRVSPWPCHVNVEALSFANVRIMHLSPSTSSKSKAKSIARDGYECGFNNPPTQP